MAHSRGTVARAMRLAAAVLLWTSLMPSAVWPQTSGQPPHLVLYYDEGPYGELYAKALQSWLGHFRLRVTRKPVEHYQRFELRQADFVAYIGSRFDNPTLPGQFLEDIGETEHPVLWLNYNVWKLETHRGLARFGFAYEFTDSGDQYSAVRYKGVLFPRDGSADLVRVKPTAPGTRVLAAVASRTGEEVPYAVQGGNMLFVADAVFSHLTDGDRSLILADLLHDFLRQPHDCPRYALIRVEDVNPFDQPARLRWIADYLASERVPFSLAVIPVHVDERGRTTPLSHPGREAVVHALRHATARGGRIFLHGFTHQYDGVTVKDWEFWDERTGQPVQDSETWAAERVSRGLRELAAVGLRASGWVTPHYMASEAHYRGFARILPTAYERQFFHDPQAGGLLLFYPYAAVDLFGRRVVPETMDSPETVLSTRTMLEVADRLRVVRCGVASFYIHVDQVRQDYRTLIAGVKQRGYTFVDAGPSSPIWRPLPPP